MFINKLSSIGVIGKGFLLMSMFVLSLWAMEPEQKNILVRGNFAVGDTVVTGRAAIVTKRKQLSKICKGDILVTTSIHHKWDLEKNLPAGIITEKEVDTSHVVLLAEKLGIPVIVGATGATKKIDNGSVIALDYSKKTVYAIEKNDFFDAHHHKHEATDFFLKQLQNDSSLIKRYITENVAYDISLAKKAGRWLAWCVNGLSYYAFDSIPFEFFTDNSSIDEVFERLEEGASYIHETKELFKKDTLGNKTKIDEGVLAEFLYKHAVDRIEVTEQEREILKKEPIKMDEYVKKGIVKKDEYMFFTLLNFTVRYYLEQELRNKEPF